MAWILLGERTDERKCQHRGAECQNRGENVEEQDEHVPRHAPILRSARACDHPNKLGSDAALLCWSYAARVGTDAERSRCRERLTALSKSGADSRELRLEAIALLRRAIGFDRWCWPTADPAAALHLTGIGELDNWQALPRMILLEQTCDPFNAMPRLAEGPLRAGILSVATRGDLARSARWDEGMRPFGIGDELRVALVDDDGMWGFIDALRGQDEPPFEAEDRQLLEDLTALLAGAVRRRSLQQPDPRASPAPPCAGVVLLDEELHVRGMTPTAQQWLTALAAGGEGAETAILGVAGRLLALRQGVALHPGGRVRLRTSSGQWAVIEGEHLVEDADAGRLAVTIRPAAPREVLDLFCAAHSFTARESQVVALLLDGLDTTAMTRALSISRHTVQDHLKAIFAKADVRSRRELVAAFTAAPSP